MKTIESYRRWLQKKLDWMEEFPPHNMSLIDWEEANEIVERAKEYAFLLKVKAKTTVKAPPRQQLVELFNATEPPEPPPTALTPPQVAKQLGVAPETVISWIRTGFLVASNLATGTRPRYVVKPSDLEDFMASRQVP